MHSAYECIRVYKFLATGFSDIENNERKDENEKFCSKTPDPFF
jgi:hypothetical protein